MQQKPLVIVKLVPTSEGFFFTVHDWYINDADEKDFGPVKIIGKFPTWEEANTAAIDFGEKFGFEVKLATADAVEDAAKRHERYLIARNTPTKTA